MGLNTFQLTLVDVFLFRVFLSGFPSVGIPVTVLQLPVQLFVFPSVVGKSCFCLFLYHVMSLKKLDAREMFADYRSGPVYSGSSSKIAFSAWLLFSTSSADISGLCLRGWAVPGDA